ncbi:MATE family efflux transporter [Psychromicrobium xiongbiense]|uniref:MATE family efflux transporter n=1 Tax=Psychromicrobium xiongbiense TaxID=3051184 RepID=UPI0025565C71|nr:MATE family efflux transporter [Psychromicrobium sp. YIM S02556]
MTSRPTSTDAPASLKLPGLNRKILHLAIPAFGALIAEPLFVIADSAIVGHLGVDQLAGVGLASTVLQSAIGLMVFLAYATTPAVARLLGAGKRAEAVAAGRDGIWLAAILGIVLATVGMLTAGPVLSALGAQGPVLEYGVSYLYYSLPGIPAMLMVLAATGVLRGLQDTRTPLVVAVAGFALNALLNWVLVYPLNLSVVGSAVGTSLAQWAMAIAYLLVVVRAAREHRVALRLDWRSLLSLGSVGGWLILRTLSLRIALLATVFVVTGQGPVNLAAHQIAMTLYNLLALALDAIAIAAQALIGRELGAANLPLVRALMRRMVWWGLGFGVVTGALLALASPWLGWVFTPDHGVQSALTAALLVLAAGQPVAGYVFVLDGVLIGAGDARYLAVVGLACLVAYLAMLWAVTVAFPPVTVSGMHDAGGHPAALAWVWVALALGYLSARAVSLGLRARGTRWQRVGAV